MESLAETYYQKLVESTKPSSVLIPFYETLFDRKVEDYASFHKMFNKLVKVYGKDLVFMTLLDIYDMENVRHENLYPLVSTICKNKILRAMKQTNLTYSPDLTEKIDKLSKKRIANKKNLGSPFDE